MMIFFKSWLEINNSIIYNFYKHCWQIQVEFMLKVEFMPAYISQ